MNQAVIGLGSNIAPEKNIREAIRLIGQAHPIVGTSTIVTTQPIGYEDQPDFLNGVVRINTKMGLKGLDAWLRCLEGRLGRVRTKNKYGPRTIDLDIVVWNGEIIDKDVHERDFLKQGVLEVWPNLIL